MPTGGTKMDHQYVTVEFESESNMMWIDYQDAHGTDRAVDLTTEGTFPLTVENIYDIIDELKKAAAWLSGDE